MKRLSGLLALMVTPVAFAAETTHGEAAHAEPWYLEVTFVAFLALVVFLLIAARLGAFKAVTSALDTRAETIQKQIDEAKALREEAAKLMADAERKAKEADEAAQDVIKRAKVDADNMMKQAKADLAAKVARREAQAEARIQRAETDATNDVRRAAADAATKAARNILSESGKSDDLFEKALKDVETSLN